VRIAITREVSPAIVRWRRCNRRWPRRSALRCRRSAWREGGEGEQKKPLCAKVAGFTLHAAQAVPAEDRAGLESLCRYGLRAPFSQRRIERHSDGRILYRLRCTWPHAGGTRILLLDPLDFLRRLAALVPAPYGRERRDAGRTRLWSRCRRRDGFSPFSPKQAGGRR